MTKVEEDSVNTIVLYSDPRKFVKWYLRSGDRFFAKGSGLTKPERIESLLEIGTSVKKVRFICSSWSEISSNTGLETQAQNVRQNELKST